MPDFEAVRGLESYQAPVVDLGKHLKIPSLQGVWSPLLDESESKRFMTSYYEDFGAVRQAAGLLDGTASTKANISQALAKAAFGSRSEPISILELGAGAGSATFPLLEIFPRAQIIASELSAAMLSVSAEKLAQRPAEAARCTLLQLNAEALAFRDKSFDLIVGAALLHHLFDPSKTLAACARLLKPGAIAIFFEPFENGMGIVNLIYQAFLRDPRSFAARPSLRRYLRHYVKTWKKMSGRDKSDPYFQGIDDKWLFTRHYFEEQTENLGLAPPMIFSLNRSPTPFLDMVNYHFAATTLAPPAAWMKKIIHEIEATFSQDLKCDLLLEGGIILRRPAIQKPDVESP